MENHNDHIDQFLFNQLNDASIDAYGIDWNAFNRKRKKRRVAFWFYTLAGVLVLVGLFLIMFNTLETHDTTKNELKPILTKKSIPIEPATIDTSEVVINISSNKKTTDKYLPKTKISKEQKSQTPETINDGNTNTFDTLKAGLQTFSYIEIQIEKKDVPTLFSYIKPVYSAEKIKENLNTPPVLKIKKPKLYWEIQAGPSLNIPDFHVTQSGRSFVHKDYESIRKVSETPVSGYNLQIALGKSVKRWNYSLGLGFSNFYMLGNYNFSYSEKPVIDVDGKIKSYLQSVPASIRFTSRQSLSFIEVPVNIQYTVIDKPKYSAGLRLGYVNQFLTGINGQLPNAVFLDERENLTTENFKLRTSCFTSGLQFLYKINKKSGLIVIPEYRRGLGFNQVQSYYKTNFNYWGLNLCYRASL